MINGNKREKQEARTTSVYVIELDAKVLESKRFRERNPKHDPAKACLYVGMTGLTPEERLAQHKVSYKACRYVTKYGLYLRKRLHKKYNPMTRDEAERREVELANELRAKGYAVWQG